MKIALHVVLFISLFVLLTIQVYGQDNRLKEAKKTAVMNESQPADSHPNIEEKKTAPLQSSKSKITPAHRNQIVTANTIQRNTPVNPGTNRNDISKAKTIKEGEITPAENVSTSANQATFPDLKVIASEEKPYENNIVLKEKSPEQMVSAKPVNTEDAALKNTNTDPNVFTISPLKRKYFETVVSELEKEIQQDSKNTSADMQAKKKELEDLKKLLAH